MLFSQIQFTNGREFSIFLVEWLAVKCLPLHFFDDDLTQQLFGRINSNLNFPKRTAMTTAVENTHEKIRGHVMKILQENKSKISFTIDGWTSVRSKSYYGITAHYIDQEWQMHSLALDFVPSKGRHTGLDIAELFRSALDKAGLTEKIGGVTVDNTSVNTTFMRDESGDEEDSTIDAPPLVKLRVLCKKIKKSEQLKNKLQDCCQFFEEKLVHLSLDVSTRWNNTYDMIAAAIRVRKSISALASKNNDLKHLVITEREWDLLSMLEKYLKCFKSFSNILCGDKYPTLPSVIVGINILLDSIEKLCFDLDRKSNRSAVDETVIHAFQASRDKILKHYDKTNWVYCAALILDPRHKLEVFDKTSWGQDLKKKSCEEFEKIFKTEYVKETEQNEKNSDSNSDDSGDEYTKNVNALYSSSNSKKRNWQRELDNYLQLGRVNRDVDIIDWWKKNETCFPQLAKMARDLLAICASSASSERLFSKASLIVRKHRNRLSNQHAEMLLCLHSWFQCSLTSKLKEVINYKLN